LSPQGSPIERVVINPREAGGVENELVARAPARSQANLVRGAPNHLDRTSLRVRSTRKPKDCCWLIALKKSALLQAWSP